MSCCRDSSGDLARLLLTLLFCSLGLIGCSDDVPVKPPAGVDPVEFVIPAWDYLDNRFFRLDLPPLADDLHLRLGYQIPDVPGRPDNAVIDAESVRVYRLIGDTTPEVDDIQYVAATIDTTGLWTPESVDAIPLGRWEHASVWRPVNLNFLLDVDSNLWAIDLRQQMQQTDVLAVTYDVVDRDTRELLYRVQAATITPEQHHVFIVAIPDSPDGFIHIPAGRFVMGSPADEPGRYSNENPQHQVALTQGFSMSKYEVTEQFWAQVMNVTPTTSQLPVNYVSWDMAVQFCNALSVREGLTPVYEIHGSNGHATWNQTANGYRLPTEAEWEYACRAGSTTALGNGPLAGSIECIPICSHLDAMGWYCGNNSSWRQLVGQKQPNAWGLYDMHGNVYEWVWCGLRTYTSSSQVDPVLNVGPGGQRVYAHGLPG